VAVVWIVEDEKIHRETAAEIVRETEKKMGVRVQTIQWDGSSPLTGSEKASPPDVVVLDLNLSPCISGLDALLRIPGFEAVDDFHPYVIIWSHFDGELGFSRMAEVAPDMHLNPDRVVRTYWKSESNLEKALAGFIMRLREEGVIHGSAAP